MSPIDSKPRPDPISIRLPEGLKSELAEAALQSNRSLNAEIRMRLEESFSHGSGVQPSDKMLANEIESLRAELREGSATLRLEIAALKASIEALRK